MLGEFLEEIKAEALVEGPAAVAELAAFDERYRLAHALMARRRELGMTQAQLAKRAGLGQADISRLEGGRANPTLSTLAAVARALGIGIGLVPLAAGPDRGRPQTASPRPPPREPAATATGVQVAG